MLEERLVAGLRCGDVLAQLSALIDGELEPSEKKKIEQHVAGCDLCERFGGEFAAAIAALRTQLAGHEPIDGAVRERLRRGLS